MSRRASRPTEVGLLLMGCLSLPDDGAGRDREARGEVLPGRSLRRELA
jgi:hypothetical protein